MASHTFLVASRASTKPFGIAVGAKMVYLCRCKVPLWWVGAGLASLSHKVSHDDDGANYANPVEPD